MDLSTDIWTEISTYLNISCRNEFKLCCHMLYQCETNAAIHDKLLITDCCTYKTVKTNKRRYFDYKFNLLLAKRYKHYISISLDIYNNITFLQNIISHNIRHIEIIQPIAKFDFRQFNQLQRLTLRAYNYTIDPYTLPSTLEILDLGDKYDKPFKEHVLPTSLKVLRLGSKYNKPFDKNVLPKNLKELTIQSRYDYYLDDTILPSTLEILDIDTYTVQFGRLPDSIKKLKIYDEYKYQFINLPYNLECLNLLNYEYKLCGNIPYIKEITVDMYRNTYAQIIPSTIKKLYMNMKYLESSIKNKNNDGLYINYNTDDGHFFNEEIPDHIEKLSIMLEERINVDYKIFNKNLKKICLCTDYIFDYTLLPNTLLSLTLYQSPIDDLQHLPISLTKLKLYQCHYDKLDLKHLINVTYFTLYVESKYTNVNDDANNDADMRFEAYTQIVSVPPNLEYYKCDIPFTYLYFNTLPHTLSTLKLVNKKSVILTNRNICLLQHKLPNNIKRLTLYDNRLIEQCLLPDDLEYLSLLNINNINKYMLPKSLKYLKIKERVLCSQLRNTLPLILEELNIRHVYFKNNNHITLPEKLKILTINDYTLTSVICPLSICTLIVRTKHPNIATKYKRQILLTFYDEYFQITNKTFTGTIKYVEYLDDYN